MKQFISINKSQFRKYARSSLLCLALICLVVLLGGCKEDVNVVTDKMISAIEKTTQAFRGESSAWRDELDQLANGTLPGLVSNVAADTDGILSHTANQAKDLVTYTTDYTDSKAQNLIAQAGAEFMCGHDFVKQSAVDTLQSLVDDLKFWQINRQRRDKKPSHNVCWINPSVLPLDLTANNNWLANTDGNGGQIVFVFGYNFWPERLPTLELWDPTTKTRMRKVNVTAAYVTHYQINLDFSTEDFPDAKSGEVIVFIWPDQTDPNTINLDLNWPGKLKISNPVFTPSSPMALGDLVSLKVTITNQGGSAVQDCTIKWQPDPNDLRVFTASFQTALQPGQSRDFNLGGYQYKRGGRIQSTVSLSCADDFLSYPLNVNTAEFCGPNGGGGGDEFTEIFPSSPTAINVWFDDNYVNGIQMVYGTALGPRHGGTGGVERTIILVPGEYIQSVGIRSGTLVDSIIIFTFHPTLGVRASPSGGYYGGSLGADRVFCGGCGMKVVGIQGLSDSSRLYQLNVFLTGRREPCGNN